MLWSQLAALHGVCGLVSIMMVCVFVQGKLNKSMRLGIYLFAGMNWVSSVGYAMFPISDSGNVSSFQNVMHIIVTVLVVLLSISSLVLIMVGGYRQKSWRSIAIWATVALALMLIGAVGAGAVPARFFGIPERFSVFSATGFTAVLGAYLFLGFKARKV
jgi:magnesium-transporting ATPase (P-type)